MSKAGGIALLILGLLVLGVSYYVKTNADNDFVVGGALMRDETYEKMV